MAFGKIVTDINLHYQYKIRHNSNEENICKVIERDVGVCCISSILRYFLCNFKHTNTTTTKSFFNYTLKTKSIYYINHTWILL